MSSISLGVAALVAIDSFSSNIIQSVKDQSRALMGGDISLNSSKPLSPATDSLLDSLSRKEIDPDDAVTYASDRRPFQRYVTDTTLMPKLDVTSPTPQTANSDG